MSENPILATLMQPLLSVAGDRMVMTDGQERLAYWNTFLQLYEIFPYKDVKYGEIYNRYMIGNLMFVLARAKLAADEKEGDENIPPLDGFPASPLHLWKEDDWEMFAQYFRAIAENLKRRDADATVPTDPEDATIVQCTNEHELFTGRFSKIIRYIKVFKALCPIRAKLTEQLADEKMGDDEYPKIHNKTVVKVWKTALGEEDEAVRDQLTRKVFEEKKEGDKISAVPKLRTIGELRKVFHQKPITLEKFDDRVELLLQDWVEATFEEPRLLSFFFPDCVDGDQSAEALMRLREARHALRQEGEDPLVESIRLASTLSTGHSATPNRGLSRAPSSHRRRKSGNGSGLYKRKRTATRLEFEDDDEPEVRSNDSNDDPTYRLSKLPKREVLSSEASDEEYTPRGSKKKKERKSQQKKYQGKRPWSEDEKKAIIEGIRTYGVSKWAEIKKKYDVLFDLRTSSQIKDCFRTMKRRGEIPAEILQESEGK